MSDLLRYESRQAEVLRKTGETEVRVRAGLDGRGLHDIQTGLPFLDHMLTQVAVHGLFDLDIRAVGDLEVDPHHCVEDTGLALGQAIRQALGDRQGIQRNGFCFVPMDESLTRVVMDFSGRPVCVFKARFSQPFVGGIPVTLYRHFFASFAQTAGCSLHLKVIYGQDDHHKVEGLFKAFGRAMNMAVRRDPRRTGVPSSKGMLA